jgi:hypothetical protein
MTAQWPDRNDKMAVNNEVSRKRLWSSPNGTEEDHETFTDILSPGSKSDQIRSKHAYCCAKTRILLTAVNLVSIFTL